MADHGNSIEIALRERVKELKCLYAISSEIESAINLSKAIEKSIDHIIDGFQFPEITNVRIRVDDQAYQKLDRDVRGMKRFLCQDINVANRKRGEITVFYLDEAEFLEEETRLVKEIANKFAMAIAKHDLEDECGNYVHRLEALVFEKTKEIEESRRINKELKELSEELHRSKKQLVTFFAAITDIIVVIDPDYTVTISNKATIGNNKCYMEIFGRESACEGCPSKNVFEKGDSASRDVRIDNKNYRLQAYPIKNGTGVVTNVLEKCSDITKEKQIEVHLIQSYKLASLGKLVAGIAHEINNPNTFIQGNLKILRESMGDIMPILDKHFEKNSALKVARLDYPTFKENVPPLLDDMVEGVNRIKKIVDGLKNFARKNEGLMDDEIDINSVITNSLRLVENQIRRHAEIALNLAEYVPLFMGNVQKLEQVIVNMLINASQAISGPGGKISIETGFYNTEKNEIFVKISDNGSGIEEKNQKYIFDPFFTTKRDNGGTGLGLSISYGIIKEHKGRIDVESSPGSGTTFTISIPCSNSQD
jgi:signal transduction histidine kinase/PAS domain-containing protein